jgi:uncharacterized membrane protein
MQVENPFAGFEDLTGTFSVTDVVLAMVLSFVLCSIVGLVYRTTHRGISYSQTYVQTLVMMGMIVSVVMLVVGSNIARAFALVGAISIIRFRNASRRRGMSDSSSSPWPSAWPSVHAFTSWRR